MAIILGQLATLTGNVTTLQWIKPGFEADTEAALGYHRGRLAQGYWIMVLKRLPQPHEFTFDGTTLNSGGRTGLPGQTEAADKLRPKVHDRVLAERGAVGYADLQRRTLGHVHPATRCVAALLVPMAIIVPLALDSAGWRAVAPALLNLGI